MIEPDSWRPVAPPAAWALRAGLLARIRRFFDARGILEVDTPALSRAAVSAPQIHSFATDYTGPGGPVSGKLYLHTSPEFAMKRMLAAGSGSIYQLAKVFRDGEAGRYHNPEFTLLEWYRPGFDHRRLMDEVEELIVHVLAGHLSPGASRQLSYAQVFQQYLDIDPHGATPGELLSCVEHHRLVPPAGLAAVDDKDPWLDLLLTHIIEPALARDYPDRPVFIYDYPASQAALARIRHDDHQAPLAERFEVYYNGVELANGFHELEDGTEQRRRFEIENSARLAQGLSPMPLDEYLLTALDHLPPCAGVALGVDRLLMLAAGATSLAEVITFPIDRA